MSNRSIHTVVQLAYAELRRIALCEGPDGLELLARSEITADVEKGKGRVRMHLQFGREIVWTGYCRIDEINWATMSDAEFQACVVAPIRESMSLVGMRVHSAVEKLFPKSVRKVDVEFVVDVNQKKFAVHFLNGHVAEVMEDELGTDVFVARCSMLYDLPPL